MWLGSGLRAPDSRRDLLEAFESFEQSGEEPDFVAVQDAYVDRRLYYHSMQQNVLAEAVQAFRAGAGRMKLQGKWTGGAFVVSVAPARSAGAGFIAGAAATPPPAELQLKDNVVECIGTLFWVTACEVGGAGNWDGEIRPEATLRGWSLTDGDLELPRNNGMAIDVHVRLFAGDYANRYRCSAELKEGVPPIPMLEQAVLNPRRDTSGTYDILNGFSNIMPINDEQRAAITGMRRRVEIIHGPPGTGKSTTIYHLLSARLPPRSVAVVTCVTNQAIDAVAEKLACAHDREGGLRMLVLGNPERVGRTAGQYTLDNLCKRDALVLSMTWAQGLLKRTSLRLDQLQRTRMERLMRPHTRSRLGRHVIENFPEVDKRMREQRELLTRGRRMDLSSPEDLHIQIINEIKQKIARAVVRHTPVQLNRYLPLRRAAAPSFRMSHGMLRRCWDVGAFDERVKAALQRADEAVRVAEHTAPNRTVRDTHVLLATIPSTYKVAQLKEDFKDDFPRRVFLGVLDEAAATAESYVPLLIRLGAENLVMLGDHKQLSPLVLAVGGDREFADKQVDRSLMERALACEVQPHRLRTQYRMPDVLCRLVSGLFYEGQLRTGSVSDPAAAMRALSVRGDTRPPVLRWFHIVAEEDTVGTSKANIAEVAQIIELLRTDQVLARTREKIMVIALYKPQMALLQHVLEGPGDSALRAKVSVVTVDAAQGSEAPHIILSTVRSNWHNNIGFATNPRRLCVAISRAQQTLTIVGNFDTFSSDRLWRRVAETFASPRTGQRIDVSSARLQGSDAWRRGSIKLEEMQAKYARRTEAQGKGKCKGKGKTFQPRTLCRYFASGRCRQGPECTYLHSGTAAMGSVGRRSWF